MKNILLALVTVMFAFSCNDGNNNSVSKNESSSNKTNSKEHIKSGYIKYKQPVEDISAYNTIYFKDNGKEKESVMEVDALGHNVKNHILVKDGYVYAYVEGEDNGKKFKYVAGNESYTQMYSITEQTLKEMYSKVGSEKVLDRDCEIYETKDTVNNKPAVKVWIWNSLVMKLQSDGSIKSEAVKIEATSNFPEGIFEIPKNVNFSDN